MASSFKSWCASEAAIVNWSSHLRTGSCLLWILSLLYWAAEEMQQEEISLVLASMMRPLGITAKELDTLAASMKSHRAALLTQGLRSVAQSPLHLFVDSDVAQFPLEACPCFRGLEVSRGIAPNVSLEAFQRQRHCSSSMQRDQSGERSLRQESTEPLRVSPQRGFYVLDPLKDATCSQTQLLDLLRSMNASRDYGTWTGSLGQPFPDRAELLARLGADDVFLYMGHGQSARKLLIPETVQMGVPEAPPAGQKHGVQRRCLPLHAVVMLMGCSTARSSRIAPTLGVGKHGRRKSRTEFEAFGMPLSLLVGGAPAMVGALWDVLGGDLEQLVCSLLKGWNTRPLRHTRSACKDKDGDSNSLLGALVKAREACKLRFLTGAAVVCYGIPL